MKKWFTSKEVRKITFVIFILCMAVITQIIGFKYLNKKLYTISLENGTQQIEELSLYVEKNFQLKLEQYIHILKTTELQLEKEENIFTPDVIIKIKEMRDNSDFKFVGISDLNGKGKNASGNDYDISYEHLRENIENDEVYISNVLRYEDEPLLFIAVPLKINNKISGIFWGKLPLKKIMWISDLNNNTYKSFHIIDDEGCFLFSSNSKYIFYESMDTNVQTIWERLDDCQYQKEYSAQEIKEKVKNGESGRFYCEIEGQGKYVSFRPLKINNWYLFSVQISNELIDYLKQAHKIVTNFFVTLSITLLIIFCVIYNVIYSMYRNTEKQYQELQTINGMFQAILEKNNNIPFAVDTKLKQVILYEYPQKGTVRHYSFADIHPNILLKSGALDTENFKEYKKLYQNVMIYGKSYKSTVLFARVNGIKQWIRLTFLSNFQNDMGQIIGVMEGYNEQKEKEIQIENHLDAIKKIEEKSQTDFLTKLYNRETFIEKVQIAIENNKNNMQICAFLILDLDHFKEVNDCMGHAMGDMVLQETAKKIQNFFRKEDIVARLGGDEFIIFAQNIRDIHAFETRITELNNLLCATYQKDGKIVKVSSSIGIVLTDTNHIDFDTLYEKADQALYRVKESGRNSYQLYYKNNDNNRQLNQ